MKQQAIATMTPDITAKTPDVNQDILHPGSRALFRYWEGIRGERTAPDRADVDLKKIKEYVPWLFVLDRHPELQSYSWRLAGTKLCQLWRKNLTGTDFFANWSRFEREAAVRLLDSVASAHQPVVLRFRLNSSLGHSIGAEFIGLPAISRDGRTTQILGSIMPFRDIENLGYDRLTGLELSGARVIWTEPIPSATAPFTGAFARPFATFQVIEGGLADR